MLKIVKYLPVILLCGSFLLAAQAFGQADTLKEATPLVRDFMQGYYFKNAAALKRSTATGSDLKALLDHPSLPPEKQEAFKQGISEIELLASFPSATDGSNRLIATFKIKDDPWVLPIVQEGQAWKVDPRYALAAKTSYQAQDPQGAIRRFATALFQVDKKELAQVALVRDAKDLNNLLKGNRLSSEDRAQIMPLVSVLPLAPALKDERIHFPSGEVRQANNDDSEQIFLGLIGVSELPFRAQKIDGAWKVHPQSYVPSLKATGMLR